VAAFAFVDRRAAGDADAATAAANRRPSAKPVLWARLEGCLERATYAAIAGATVEVAAAVAVAGAAVVAAMAVDDGAGAAAVAAIGSVGVAAPHDEICDIQQYV
jgi:hypothetical protein